MKENHNNQRDDEADNPCGIGRHPSTEEMLESSTNCRLANGTQPEGRKGDTELHTGNVLAEVLGGVHGALSHTGPSFYPLVELGAAGSH